MLPVVNLALPFTSKSVEGLAVLTPTLPPASTMKGVVSEAESSTRREEPNPLFSTRRQSPVFVVLVETKLKIGVLPVIAFVKDAEAKVLTPATVKLPLTESLPVGLAVPMPQEPVAVMTKGLESGFAASSTRNASPVPNCVTRRAAVELSVTSITCEAVKVLLLAIAA
jgi:hypothetical protein